MIVVFDLDGTLIDSSKSILESHKAAWSSVGAKCPPEDEILRLTGLPLIEIMQKLGPAGIRWVSELIEIAGGEDIFANKSHGKLATEREIQWSDVIEKNPDVILASWCGKPVDIDSIKKREGWNQITAIKNNRIHEIDSSIILQPGPACLTDGLKVLEQLITRSK